MDGNFSGHVLDYEPKQTRQKVRNLVSRTVLQGFYVKCVFIFQALGVHDHSGDDHDHGDGIVIEGKLLP